MADQTQDFNINIRTLADLTGIKITEQQLRALQHAAIDGNKQAIGALKQLSDAQKEAQGGLGAGLTGSAIGVGTIVSLVTVAINRWKAFNDEQDRWFEGMTKAREKAYELGLSVADMLEAMKSAERIETEPLQVSFDRLTQKVGELKTEMQLAFSAGAYDASALGVVESQLNRVTSGLNQEAEAAKRATEAAQSELEKRVPGLKQPDIKQADAQVQAILKNEQAAAAARAAGNEKDAEMFQKSADKYKESATPQQLEDLQRIHELQDKLKPPAQPGYRPLTPEEFAQASEAAGGAEPKLTPEEMRQRQLDNEEARKKGIKKTAQESRDAKISREASNDLKFKDQRAGEIERQTQDNKGVEAKLDTLIGLFR
jgi:hypothetical protein